MDYNEVKHKLSVLVLVNSFFLTGKDVEDLHQIGTHHFLNRELLYRLQQGKENYISSHLFLN